MCRLRCFSSVPPQLPGEENITVEEEAEFHLTCDIWANPEVSDVVWRVNKSIVNLEEIGMLFTNDGFKTELSTWKAERGRHEGAYECSVTYFSEVYTKTFNVKLTGQFSEYVLERFSSPPCACVAVSIPSSLSFPSVDKTLKFPLMPMIAAIVIVSLTLLLAIFARWRIIMRVTYETRRHRQQD